MKKNTTFSIELISRQQLNDVSISSSTKGRVFFEGSLGDIEDIHYVNGSVLEFKGAKGTICIGVEKKLFKEYISGDGNL